MIEKDFDELDNDYITLWSRYSFDEDLKIFPYLEKLAELGNVHALCAFFLHEKKPNKIIKQNWKQLEKNLSNPEFMKESDAYLLKMYYELINANFFNRKGKYSMVEAKALFDAHNICKYILLTNNGYSNLLLKEKLYEIKNSFNACRELGNMSGMLIDWGELNIIREDLKKAMWNNPQDPRYAYYFARCVTQYLWASQQNLLPNGYAEESQKIYERLSKRPLSKTLQEYVKINGIKDNIDTENVEKISEEEVYKNLSESVRRWQKNYKKVVTDQSFKNNDNNQKGDDDSENSF